MIGAKVIKASPVSFNTCVPQHDTRHKKCTTQRYSTTNSNENKAKNGPLSQTQSIPDASYHLNHKLLNDAHFTHPPSQHGVW